MTQGQFAKARTARFTEDLDVSVMVVGDVLVASLTGVIFPDYLEKLGRRMLETVYTEGLTACALSLERVSSLDRPTLDAINEIAQAAGLLGAEVYLCGLRPYIAATIVGLGADLDPHARISSLDQAVRHHARSKRAVRKDNAA